MDAPFGVVVTGGSPRVRGRATPYGKLVKHTGWIPAGAGEGRPPWSCFRQQGVDPRGCGGGWWSIDGEDFDEGGSPRVRGREEANVCLWFRVGWIPAGAGEGRGGAEHDLGRRVDPRGCGGGAITPGKFLTGAGGSPRVRGRGNGVFEFHARDGWIPAGAGEGRRLVTFA